MAITFNHNDQVYVKDGKMGIGASDPLRDLHVVGDFSVNASTSQYYGVLINGGESSNPAITIGDWHNSSATIKWDSTNNYLVIDSQHSSSGSSILFTGNDSATEYMRITGTGNVGIGTTNPTRTLHVVGGDSGTGTHIAHFEGRFGVVGMYIRGDGNVGIGTTSPSEKLHVVGTGMFTDFVRFNGVTAPDFPVDIDSVDGGKALRSTRGTSIFRIDQTNDGPGYIGMQSADDLSIQTNNTSKMYITSGGNVGIGTTNPVDKLDVTDGNAKMVFGSASSDRAWLYFQHNAVPVDGEEVGLLDFRGYNDASQDTRYVILTAKAEDVTDGSEDGSLTFQTMAAGTATQTLTMRSGNVGIGTTNPSEKLHVVGNTFLSANSAYMASYNNTNSYHGSLVWAGLQLGNNGTNRIVAGRTNVGGSFQFWTNNTNNAADYQVTPDGVMAMSILANGNVGIGTSSPNTFLHIAGQGNRSGGQIYLGNQDDGSVKYSLITSAHYNAATEPEGFTLITGLSTATENTVSIGGFVYESNPATDIRFFTHTATTHTTGGSERMRITSSGNVGIGTTSPGSTLEVDGSFNVVNGNNSITHFNYVDGSTNYVRGITYFDNASAYFTGGNVGIGTTSPTAKLHVDIPGNTVAFRATRNGGADGDLELTFGSAIAGYNSKAGAHRWLESSSEKMRLTGGNLGIGTTSPSAKLHVQGNGEFYSAVGTSDDVRTGLAHYDTTSSYAAGVGGQLVLGYIYNSIGSYTEGAIIKMYKENSTSGHYGSGLKFQVRNSGVSLSTKMILDPSGNVGIGTTAPSAKLDIYGDSNSADNMIELINSKYDSTNTAGETGILFGWNNHVAARIAAFKEGTVNRTGFKIVGEAGFNVATTIATFRSTGRVGIGTTDPISELHVVGSARVVTNDSAGGDTLIGAINGVSNGYRILTNTSNEITYSWNTGDNVQAVTINNSGNVGIGTTSPSTVLDVVGEGTAIGSTGYYYNARFKDTANVGVLIGHNNTSNGNGMIAGVNKLAFLTYGTDWGERMVIDGDGNVGIGTTSPNRFLTVSEPGAANGSQNITAQFGNVTVGATSSAIYIGAHSGTDWLIGKNIYGTAGSTNFEIGNQASGSSPVISINNNNNVGIGTTSPQSKLHVQGGAGIFNVSDDWQQSTYRTHLFRGGGFNSSISEESTAVKIFNGSALDGKSVGNYWGGIGFMHLDPEYGSWGTSYTGEHFWIGGRLIDTPQQERSALVFATNNVTTAGSHSSEKMVILPNGNVGIGTTGPNQKLHVEGAIYAGTANSTSGSLILVGKYNNGNIITIGGEYSNGGIVIGYGVKPSTTASGAFLSSSALANLERGAYTQVGSEHRWWSGAYQTVAEGGAVTMSRTMTLDGAGNLGIGTTSPSRKLHIVDSVWDNSNGGGVIFENSNTVGASLTLKPSASVVTNGANGWALYAGGPGAAIGDGNLGFWAHATNDARMVIQRGGNVGIGTTSPAVKLDVNGDIALKGTSVFNLNSAALTIGDTAGTDSVTTLKLTTAGDSTTVYLDDDGNVGINTATPSYNLTVDSGTNDIGILTASSDSGSYVGFLDNSTSTIPKIGAVGNKLILDASQYVGIKRTDPSYALDVSGTIRATGDVIAYSDARVKENVETIPNALDKVKAMRGVGYNKIGEQKRSIGVIAQEMIEVMPEVVSQDEQGMYSVAYGNLVGVLVEAMKEQQKQIDELKAIIANR